MMNDPQAIENAINHHKAGRFHEAETIYRRILSEEPEHAETLHLLGIMAYQQERLDDAIAYFQRAIESDSSVGKYHGNLGTVHAAAGRVEEAIDHLERAAILDPDNANVHNSLGAARRELGEADAAIASYREAIRIDPDHAMAHGNLAIALLQAGTIDDALASANAAVAADGADATHHNTLATCLMSAGRQEEGVAALEAAIGLDPGLIEAHRNLGLHLQQSGRLDEAEARFREVIALKPGDAAGQANLAITLRRQGRGEEAIPYYRGAVAAEPGNAVYRSNLLFMLNASREVSDRELFEEHRRWNEIHAAPLKSVIRPHANDRDPDRRLRIGYVSPDLRRHPVATYLLPVLANHDPAAVETVCYAAVAAPDEVTARLRERAGRWRDVTRLDDAALADAVREDGIDILVDLAGHTARNRLLAFARKPAPVQAAWAGYPNTTGLDAMDYLIGDPVQTPDSLAPLYSETIVRMTRTMLCFEPFADAPPVVPLPALEADAITFGSLNNPGKLAAPVIELWAQVLEAVPGSRLVLKYPGLDDGPTGAHLLAAFARHGVAAERLELRGATPHGEVLGAYDDIDIALDPSPYSGNMTTVEALWMGVPVVTLAGSRFSARMSAGHLTTAGLGELIAGDESGYLGIVRRLAGDLDGLAAMRAGLRRRLADSALCDGAGFTRDLEALYRDMWRRWCAEA